MICLIWSFLTEALSFSPLCSLLIGHEVLRVAERLVVLSRWQETAEHRRVLLKQSQLLFLILFCFALLVYTYIPYTGNWEQTVQ
jgi:small neutral amino acid transporter SnatA (MarC family)